MPEFQSMMVISSSGHEFRQRFVLLINWNLVKMCVWYTFHAQLGSSTTDLLNNYMCQILANLAVERLHSYTRQFINYVTWPRACF